MKKKISDILIPANTWRRFFVKLIYRFVRNPGFFFNKLNRKGIRNFINMLKYKTSSEADFLFDLSLFSADKKYIGPKTVTLYTAMLSGESRIKLPYYENPKVSIIIPAYNQFYLNINCIYSIICTTKDISYEVILVDDVSTDKTANIEEYVENLIVIRNKENKGFLRNCNNAAKKARGEYLFFLNNDTNVQENWLKPLIDVFERDEKAGLVGSKLVYANNALQEAGGIVWKDGSAWNFGRMDDKDKAIYNYLRETDYVSGAAIMIKKSIWDEVGGFDKRYIPAYYEDTDLAFKVRKHGYKVYYQPLSVVVHFEGMSNGTDVGEGLKKYQVENARKFYEKWKDVLEKEHYPNGENVFRAHNKSKNKKTILVIDHHVPFYDKDAGSRNIYTYLKLMVKMGLSVIFAGDNFYPHEPYTTALTQMGVNVLYGNEYVNTFFDWLKKNGGEIDYVFLHRPHISVNYINYVRKYTKAKILYACADIHFLRLEEEYKLTGDIKKKKESEKWKKIEFSLFERADIIQTLSVKEKAIIQKYYPDKNTVVWPIFCYNEFFADANSDFDKRQGLLFVGGFGHPPNADAVKWFTSEILPIVKKEIPDITFSVIGSSPPDEIKALEGESVKILGFVSDEELIQNYNSKKICVIPLRFGAGVKGKTIEAMYYGIPIVSTSFGVEGIKDLDSLLVPTDNAREFAERIIELYNDSEMLKELSEKEMKFIKDNFSEDSFYKAFKESYGENGEKANG